MENVYENIIKTSFVKNLVESSGAGDPAGPLGPPPARISPCPAHIIAPTGGLGRAHRIRKYAERALARVPQPTRLARTCTYPPLVPPPPPPDSAVSFFGEQRRRARRNECRAQSIQPLRAYVRVHSCPTPHLRASTFVPPPPPPRP